VKVIGGQAINENVEGNNGDKTHYPLNERERED